MDQEVLYVCPSEEWSTKERRALNDCLVAKQEGYRPLLYCLRDSFLDIKAKEAGIERIYQPGRVVTRITHWNRLKKISTLLMKREVVLVHVYDLNLLLPLSFFLRRHPLTPLVFTQNGEVKHPLHKIWFKPLISRVDLVILPFGDLMDNIDGKIGIPARRQEALGLGLELSPRRETKDLSTLKELENDFWLVGASFGIHHKDIKTLKPILYSIASMNGLKVKKKQIKFVVIAEKDWSKSVYFPEIRKLLYELKIEEDVLFFTYEDVPRAQLLIDAWIGLETKEVLEDYVVSALMRGVPAIVPRSAVSQDLLQNYDKIGETYKQRDPRELRFKIIKVLESLNKYHKNLSSVEKELVQTFGHRNYRAELIKFYKKLGLKRRRYHARRLGGHKS